MPHPLDSVIEAIISVSSLARGLYVSGSASASQSPRGRLIGACRLLREYSTHWELGEDSHSSHQLPLGLLQASLRVVPFPFHAWTATTLVPPRRYIGTTTLALHWHYIGTTLAQPWVGSEIGYCGIRSRVCLETGRGYFLCSVHSCALALLHSAAVALCQDTPNPNGRTAISCMSQRNGKGTGWYGSNRNSICRHVCALHERVESLPFPPISAS